MDAAFNQNGRFGAFWDCDVVLSQYIILYKHGFTTTFLIENNFRNSVSVATMTKTGK